MFIHLSSFSPQAILTWISKFLAFYFDVVDVDMDVPGCACLLVCRGEGTKVLQVWQLFCPAIEGRSNRHVKLELLFSVPPTNPVFLFLSGGHISW
jgi:hypothetical protein